MTERLKAAFERARSEKRPALITLVIPGYPSPTATDDVFDAMVEGGADVIEVEIPFSDPLADGATIQNVVFEALEHGITPRDWMVAPSARGSLNGISTSITSAPPSTMA